MTDFPLIVVVAAWVIDPFKQEVGDIIMLIYSRDLYCAPLRS